MYSHTLCPVSLPFPALLPQGVPCKGLCQMRVFTVVRGTTSSPRGPRSWTKPCQMMFCSPAPTLLSQSHCPYGDHPILWEWNHYMVRGFPIFLTFRGILCESSWGKMFVTAVGSSILILFRWGESSHMTKNIKKDKSFIFFPHFSGCKMAWLVMHLPCGGSREKCLSGCKFL